MNGLVGVAGLLEQATDEDARHQRERALGLVARGQAPSGGWGPYVSSPPEPFDTAVVLLALVGLRSNPMLVKPLTGLDLTSAIARGRDFLLERQLLDGSWVETTRPPGQQSYARYISTSGWATLALLATRGER